MRVFSYAFILVFYFSQLGCVTVEEFDFENYETSKAKSIIFKEPIVNKPKKANVVVLERMVAKVQEAKKKRAQTNNPEKNPVVIPKVTMKEAVQKAEVIEQKQKATGVTLYTPKVIVDNHLRSDSQLKGAAQLVWTKRNHGAEVEIFQKGNPKTKRSIHTEKHFLHIMVYFNREYLWRVRLVDKQGSPVSEFSYLKPLQILRGRVNSRELSSPNH